MIAIALTTAKRQNSWHLVMKIIPADATIADLAQKAAELEQKAKTETERIATHLREKAKFCREWIAALKSGRWTS
jgi:hypothetical protein